MHNNLYKLLLEQAACAIFWVQVIALQSLATSLCVYINRCFISHETRLHSLIGRDLVIIRLSSDSIKSAPRALSCERIMHPSADGQYRLDLKEET